jgi:hypothetical protein
MENKREKDRESSEKFSAGQPVDDSTMSEEAKQSTTAAPWGAPVETNDEKTSD